MQSNSAPVKGASTNKCWHSFREQLKDIDTIIQRRYNDSVPESPVGMALVDQAISRIRCLAKLDKVDDCGLREAEVFCGNYAPWMDAGEYSFKGYDPTTALKSKELGQAIELTAQEKYKWGIKYIKSVDVVPDIEAAKAERKKYQAAARKERHRRKMQAEKAKIERQANLQVHELAAQGFDNEQIAKAKRPRNADPGWPWTVAREDGDGTARQGYERREESGGEKEGRPRTATPSSTPAS
jgi:hypothetical protein